MRDAADVVVTGMGVVTPAGSTLESFWSRVCEGRSTAVLRPGEHGGSGHVVCPIDGCDDRHGGGPARGSKELRRADPFARYAVAAALDAYRAAGEPAVEAGRGAVIVGNAVGGRTVSDRESRHFWLDGPGRVNPLMPVMTMPNAAAALVSVSVGFTGPCLTIATTCASSADAIGHGARLLAAGDADVVIAGGCEATITPVTLAAFSNLRAMSERRHDPAGACRPFDRDRDGFVMGEGAGFMVLERAADARSRRAAPLARLSGYASTCDAHHLTAPAPDGEGAVRAMRGALASAGMEPADIVHVNAHGTSTPINDRVEAAAIGSVFGSRSVPVTSTKGVVGHLIGAAGAVELITTVLSMRHGCVPPTANLENLDPSIDLDVVAGVGRSIPSGPALSNSFGFGGHNACIVVEPVT